ncbi:MAG: hypothetical protein ACK5L7_06615, partial [Paludibacteraceae bacterium]
MKKFTIVGTSGRKKILGILSLFLLAQSLSAAITDFTLTLTPVHMTCTGNGQIVIDIADTQAGAVFDLFVYQLPNTTNPIRTISDIPATGTTLTHTETGFTNGSYRVLAIQTFGTETNQKTADVTINDVRQNLAFTVTQTAACAGNSTLTVNVTAGHPANYKLLNSSNGAVVIPPQTSNILQPVAPGSYNVVVTDVCGNSKSLGVTVTTATGTYDVQRSNSATWGFNNMTDCNNIYHQERLRYNNATPIPIGKFPITQKIEIENPTGGAATVINRVMNSNTDNEYGYNIPYYYGYTYNHKVTYTDVCGTVYTFTDKITATPSIRYRTLAAGCGSKYIALDQFWNHYSSVEIKFTNYPVGFDPANYNSDFITGTYTHTYPSVPSGVNFGNASSAGVPDGSYTIQVTSCGRTRTYTFPVTSNVTYSLRQIFNYSGCGDNEGSISFAIRSSVNATQADNLTSVKITSAPTAFVSNYGALPYDVSYNIASTGAFYMNSLPAGHYSVQATGTCGITMNDTLTIYDKSITSTVTPTYHCGAFDVAASISSYLGGEIMWLQKYYPASSRWGHPTTGGLYSEGGTISGYNGMNFNGGVSTSGYSTASGELNNITSTGLFRVIVQYKINSNGSDATIYCRDVLETFEITPAPLTLNSYYVTNCVSGKTELTIDASGNEPLQYEIIEYNGNPYTVDNGTNPIFSELSPGKYKIRVTDECGNSRVAVFKTDAIKSPVIVPSNLCDGQVGKLYIKGLSFLHIEWTKGTDPTVIATGNTLTFNPFNAATNVGTYYAHLSYPTSSTACIAQTLSFEIKNPAPAPEAGTGQTVNIIQQNAEMINLFDYLTPPYDNYGEWTDLSNTGYLNGEILDAGTLAVGTYQFKYTVLGICTGSDDTIVTVNILPKNLWVGNISTDWSNSNNWTTRVPNPGEDVEFATAVNNKPGYGNGLGAAQRDLILDQDREISNLINESTKATVIPAGAGLVVSGTVTGSSTDPGKLRVEASSSLPNGSLLLKGQPCNSPVMGTVQMYAKGYKQSSPYSWTDNIDGSPTYNQVFSGYYHWQYFGVPVQSVVADPTFYGSYLREYSEAANGASSYYKKWITLYNSSVLTAFKGYEITQDAPKILSMQGSLVFCDKTLTLTHLAPLVAGSGSTGGGDSNQNNLRYGVGQNVFGNSITAALPLANIGFPSDGSVEKTVYMFNTSTFGLWAEKVKPATQQGTSVGMYIAIPQSTGSAMGYG